MITVLGDVMVDEYLYGTIDRISPEAPVPILKLQRVEQLPGGAANVAHNVLALGAEVVLVGVVGPNNPDVQALGGVVLDQSRPTTKKQRLIAQGQQVARIDIESCEPISGQVERAIIERLNKMIPESNVLIISDYGKGVITDNVCVHAILTATDCGVHILIDPKRSNWDIYRGATVIKPNLSEFTAAVGKWDADWLMQNMNNAKILVTKGAQGMTLCQLGQDPLDFEAHTQEVVDVTGAGDTVIAALAVALEREMPLATAVAFANKAAGIVVRKRGTAVVSLEEMR
jgi:rfaE bifunctional protein kinase chain/domain